MEHAVAVQVLDAVRDVEQERELLRRREVARRVGEEAGIRPAPNSPKERIMTFERSLYSKVPRKEMADSAEMI